MHAYKFSLLVSTNVKGNLCVVLSPANAYKVHRRNVMCCHCSKHITLSRINSKLVSTETLEFENKKNRSRRRLRAVVRTTVTVFAACEND